MADNKGISIQYSEASTPTSVLITLESIKSKNNGNANVKIVPKKDKVEEPELTATPSGYV